MSNIKLNENKINLFSVLKNLPLPKFSALKNLMPIALFVALFVSVLALTFYAIPHSIEWIFQKKEFMLELSSMVPNDEAELIRHVAEQANKETWKIAQNWATLACQSVFLGSTFLGSIAFKFGSKVASKNTQKELKPLQETILSLKKENNALQKALKEQVERNVQIKEQEPLLKEEAEKFRLLVKLLSSTKDSDSSTTSKTSQPSSYDQ